MLCSKCDSPTTSDIVGGGSIFVGFLLATFFLGGWLVPNCGTKTSTPVISPAEPLWKVVLYDHDHKEIERYYSVSPKFTSTDYVQVHIPQNTVIYDHGLLIATELTPAEAQEHEREKGQIKVK